MGPPREIGEAIRARVFAETGLTASVGIGPNRLIAKLGSEYRKPDGLTVVTPEQVLDFLAPMPVSNLRGVGRKTLPHFERLHIHTVAELRSAPMAKLEEALGPRAAASFKRQAEGIAADEIVPQRQRKSMSKERTFENDLRDSKALQDQLRELAAGVAKLARREQLAGRVVTLKIRYTGFETHTRQRKLAAATQDERVLMETAWALFLGSGLPDKAVRLIGVGLSDWDTAHPQADLFDAAPNQAAEAGRLLETIDRVNERFGSGKLQIGLSRKHRD